MNIEVCGGPIKVNTELGFAADVQPVWRRGVWAVHMADHALLSTDPSFDDWCDKNAWTVTHATIGFTLFPNELKFRQARDFAHQLYLHHPWWCSELQLRQHPSRAQMEDLNDVMLRMRPIE